MKKKKKRRSLWPPFSFYKSSLYWPIISLMAMTLLHDTTYWPDSPLSCNNILLILYHIVPKVLLSSISRIFLAVFKLFLNKQTPVIQKSPKQNHLDQRSLLEEKGHLGVLSPTWGPPKHLSGAPGLQFEKHAPRPQLYQLLFPWTRSVYKLL